MMQSSHNRSPMQASNSVAHSGATTRHIAARKQATMSMEAIVTEMNALSTDAAGDLITAAHVFLKGTQGDVRNLCKPWGVPLRINNDYHPMEIIKHELKIAFTNRAMKLKTKHIAAKNKPPCPWTCTNI